MSNNNNKKLDPILLGGAIVQARQKKQLTQQQLADALGVTNKTVSKWECGRGLPDQSMFEPLERILAISVGDYVCEEPKDDYSRSAKIISRVALTVFSVLVVVGVVFAVISLTTEKPPVPVHVCQHVCSVCGLCLSDCSEHECVKKCKGHYDVDNAGEYIFEAENCEFEGGPVVFCDAGSGEGYLGNFDFHDGATMTYRFTSRNDVTAKLYFSLTPREINDVCNDTYRVNVNGKLIFSRAVFRGDFLGWTNFVEYFIGDVSLKSGDNVIEIVYCTNEVHNNGHNFDYIKLNTRDVEKSADIVLEAEESIHDERLGTRNEIGSGLGYLGDFDSCSEAKLRFDFTSDFAERRSMFFSLVSRGINDNIDDTYTIVLNGTQIASNGTIFGSFEGKDRWTNFKEYFIANIWLVKGQNVLEITFHSNKTEEHNGNNGHNFDYVRLVRTRVAEFDGNDKFVDATYALKDSRLSLVTSSTGKPYIGDFDKGNLAEVRFFVDSAVQTNVALSLNIVPRGHNELITDSYDIYVNGKIIRSDSLVEGAFEGFENFVEYFVANVVLNEGSNEILLVFKCNEAKNNGLNLGDVVLRSVD